MFETLTARLQSAFRRLSGKGKLTPRDVRDGLKEVRLALLEADVNYQVAKDFVNDLQQEAVGEEILRGLNPTQQIIKLVHGRLVHLLGEKGCLTKDLLREYVKQVADKKEPLQSLAQFSGLNEKDLSAAWEARLKQSFDK